MSDSSEKDFMRYAASILASSACAACVRRLYSAASARAVSVATRIDKF